MPYTFRIRRSGAILDAQDQWRASNIACVRLERDVHTRQGSVASAVVYAYDHRYGEPFGIKSCSIESSLGGLTIYGMTNVLPSGETANYGDYVVERYEAVRGRDAGFLAVEYRDSEDVDHVGHVVIAGSRRHELLTLSRANYLLVGGGPTIDTIDTLLWHPSGFIFSGLQGDKRQSFLCQTLEGRTPLAVHPYFQGYDDIRPVNVIRMREDGEETLVLFATNGSGQVICVNLDRNYRLASDFRVVAGEGRYVFSDVAVYSEGDGPTRAVMAFGTLDLGGSLVPHVFHLAWEKI